MDSPSLSANSSSSLPLLFAFRTYLAGCWWWAHFCVRFPGSWSVFGVTLVIHSEGKTQLLQLVLAVFFLFFFSEYAGLAWADAEWDILVAGLLSCLHSIFPGCYQQLEIIPCVSIPSSVHTWKQVLLSQKLSGLKWEVRCDQGLSCLVVSLPYLKLTVCWLSLVHLVLASTVSAGSILHFLSLFWGTVGSFECPGVSILADGWGRGAHLGLGLFLCCL